MSMWLVIFSGVLCANLLGAGIGLLLIKSKWYIKWTTKLSWKMTEELMKSYSEEQEEVKGL